MSIVIQNLVYEHPDRVTLFEELNFAVDSKQKIALIGNNGTGKSTLLKLISKTLTPKSGSIYTSSDPYYIPQHIGQYDDETVGGALCIDQKLKALKLIEGGDVSEINYEMLGDDWDIEQRAYTALQHWNFEIQDLDRQMKDLSGGEKTKVFLAGISIYNPSLILMDEPTNHLDYIGRDKLYDLIQNTKATVLLVSHDRKLLNLLTGIYELSGLGIKYYAGNYDAYQVQKQQEISAIVHRLESKEKELKVAAKTKQEMAERRQKLDARGKAKGVKMGLGKMALKIRQDRAEKTTARLKDTHGDKLDDISQDIKTIQNEIEKRNDLKLRIDKPNLHKGKILVKGEDVNFAYDGKVNLWDSGQNFTVHSGDRVLIKGSNGSGKTTLLNLMTNRDTQTSGNLYIADFNYMYLDQSYSLINNQLTVYNQAQRFNLQMPEYAVKRELHRLQLPHENWDKPCATLSGGEKMKLSLCCLFISSFSPDVIILDEPTNNIDIQSIKVLEAAISSYQGTLLVVSHDQSFVESLALTMEIDLSANM